MVRTPLRRAVMLSVVVVWAVSAAAAPQVAVIRSPSGIMQPIGGPLETDSFVIANAGPDAASITLVPNGKFFGVTPSSFTLDPGTTRTVTIVPSVTQGGFYEGSVGVFIGGAANPLSVPVRLFIGNQPAGTVTPATSSDTLIIAGLQGSTHPGSVAISNLGNATMDGMLVPGASWIVPQNAINSVSPHASVQMPFLIDPSQRPDAIFPLGAMQSRVSMIYLKGSGSLPGLTQTGNVNVNVYDFSKVSVVPSEPPAVASGESIAFVPGITDIGFFTDVFLSNRATTAFSSDLRLFFTSVGAAPATSLLANIGRLPAKVAAWFPASPWSIFNVTGQTGTVQVRSTEPGKVSIAAIRGLGDVNTNTRYLTAMPVLTSDRAVGAGDRLLFAGVEKSATAHTDIFLQESAGFSGAYTIDFFDAGGTPVAPSRSGSILPFGFLTLTDSVPSGARSARITNTSGGTARLTGFATILDESTHDAWTIIDASRGPGPTTDLVLPVPMLTGAPSTSTFDAWITNGSTSPANVTIGTSSAPSKRRAVKQGHGAGPEPESEGESFLFAPGETRRIALAATPQGYIHINGPAGAISATGRLTSTVSGGPGSFGTGVPAVPAVRAAGPGTVKRFSRANDTPNFAPPALLLLEVTGRPATVRVTVGFSFSAGTNFSGYLDGAKEFNLAAGQLMKVPDIVRSIIGPGRDSLGTLINIVVDVEVIGGDGRVLSYLQTIDSSGDLTFSVD
ncbi:MAG TPA: hypothetical protein VLV78_17100 [Thermoanaerobaculia bacterium]|nr:hypothetical protein [Thermoanaerobaculia bacterium]